MVQEPAGAGSFGYDRRPVTPRIVYSVAAGVALLGLLNIIRVTVQTVMTFAGDEWSTGARAMYLILNTVPFAVSVFLLPLAYLLVRGRSWAWITAVVLVSLATIVGAFLLLVGLATGEFPLIGLASFALPLAVLLGLTVPRSVRAYFNSKPAPAPYPVHPAPGPWSS
jgi:hypothetical protein